MHAFHWLPGSGTLSSQGFVKNLLIVLQSVYRHKYSTQFQEVCVYLLCVAMLTDLRIETSGRHSVVTLDHVGSNTLQPPRVPLSQ